MIGRSWHGRASWLAPRRRRRAGAASWGICGLGTGATGRVVPLYDIGQATAFIMLAAADLAIGSGHSAVGDQQQAQRVLGFPGGYLAVYMIGLGYPAGRPLHPLSRPNRRPFDEIVHW
jgi:nitroreductase